MGELMPATIDNPLGYFEAQGVVDAHRDLLFQMERDWTCPPADFRPADFDLSRLEEQVAIHRQLKGAWAVKDPRAMFLLKAWRHLGVKQARLVGVVRAPADTIRSIERRDGLREDRAEAIVEQHLERLAEIAGATKLPVIQFSRDGKDVLRQVRLLAASLDLDWDQEAAEGFFDPELVRHRSPLAETSPEFDLLMSRSFDFEGRSVPSTALSSLKLLSSPARRVEEHLAIRYGRQRHELWKIADFGTVPQPEVVELLLEGARLGGGHRPGVAELHQIEVSSPLTAGSMIMRNRLRPHGVIAHGILRGHTQSAVEFFFRSLYVSTHAFAELVVDAPSPTGAALLNTEPKPILSPRPSVVIEIAERTGWDHVTTQRVSPGRVGLVFRKRVTTDSDLVPVVTDLIAGLDRLHALDREVAALTKRTASLQSEAPKATAATTEASDRARQESAAERDLRRLRSRRSVRLALALSSPFGRVFRLVRTWKKSR